MEHPSMKAARCMLPLALVVTLVLAFAMPARAQDESAYFSLSTYSTTKPGESPKIQVYTSKVRSLEFRVYKVNDPVEFFRSLEDLHGFGGRAPQVPRDLTPIERFHRLKTQLRSRVVRFFRSQYSADSRTVIRNWRNAPAATPAAARPAGSGRVPDTYPTVPLLNPQQVVSVWRENFSDVMGWESREISLSVPGKGVYLVEATNGALRAYTIASVTDIVIISKMSAGRLLSFVANREDGVPVGNADLWVFVNRKELVRATTDDKGIYDAKTDEMRAENVLVLAKRGDDFAAHAPYGFALSNDPSRYLTGYIYSDRPVYRPGHTVHFKGVLRSQAGWEYRQVPDKEVLAEVQDPEGNTLYRKQLRVSSVGSVDDFFELPATAALGYYEIRIRLGDASVSGGFQVEEYRKPEYEVKVLPERTRLLQGDNIQARFEARYYFGEPVAFGKVTYVVHRSDYWFYPRDEEEEYGEEPGEYDDYGGAEVAEQTVQLDAEGKANVTIPTDISPNRRDVRYRVEARVSDESNREISGHGYVIATYGSFAVNVVSSSYVVQAGGTGTFTAEARDYDNRVVQTDIRFDVRSSRRGRAQQMPVLFTATARTDAGGKASVTLPFQNAGSYEVTATARTPEEREVSDTTYVWVTGGALPRYFDETRPIEIVPDKSSYAPGDIAHVLVSTGIPDTHPLITIEGQAIDSYEVRDVPEGSFTVDVPIRAEFAPNFFMSVAFLKNNQLYSGMKSIRVPPTEREVVVQVQPSKPQFKPGEPVLFSVLTQDRAGRPVSAEVSLGVVDEAIYAVQPEAARDIVQSFYGRRYNRTNTDSSLSYSFQGQAGVRQMRLTQVRPSKALGQLKPERLQEPNIRKAFPATAFWTATLTTDASGRGEARFAFPDALTTWRATARAVTADTRVGSDVERTLVRKDVIVRLSVPRFFTEGDEVTVSAIVHNYLDSEKKAAVSLAVDGLEILQGGQQEIVVPSRGDAKVDWRVRAGSRLEAKLLAKALTNEESDGLELTLPVIPYGVKLSSAHSGSLSQTAAASARIDFPATATPSSRSLQIHIAPSIAGAVFGALDYLATYPYGCTEQTMSSFLPGVIVNQALKDLKIKSDVNEAALAQKVREGLARLYDFQHEDGGWGWWQTDESGTFMTAYVVAGLAQARDAGINVRPDVLQRGIQWLAADFQRSSAVVPEMRAYMLYALALSGTVDRARLDSVWQDRSRLGPYGRTLLGLALDKAGDVRASEIAIQLEAEAKSNERESYWESNRDWLLDFEGDSSAEATALALKLLARYRPSSPLLPKAAFWLVGHRNEGYYWYSTKQTAIVVHGLTDYLKLTGELEGNSSIRVLVDGKQVLSRTFTPQDMFSVTSPSVRIPYTDLAAASHEVRIEKTGSGTVYWDTRAEYSSTEEKLMRTGTVALNVLRDYFTLAPQQEQDRIVYQLQPMSGSLKPGDVIAVRLTISGGPWRYLFAEDPIPAGTEFIKRDDLYTLKERPGWWDSWFTRREYRDDRAAFFQTSFNGQIQYFYLLKVVNPGQFKVSPARVQPMYQPQFLSATESQMVVVNP